MVLRPGWCWGHWGRDLGSVGLAWTHALFFFKRWWTETKIIGNIMSIVENQAAFRWGHQAGWSMPEITLRGAYDDLQTLKRASRFPRLLTPGDSGGRGGFGWSSPTRVRSLVSLRSRRSVILLQVVVLSIRTGLRPDSAGACRPHLTSLAGRWGGGTQLGPGHFLQMI